MNEFEHDPQEKQTDIVASIKGFTFSLGFFLVIFFIGVVISLID